MTSSCTPPRTSSDAPFPPSSAELASALAGSSRLRASSARPLAQRASFAGWLALAALLLTTGCGGPALRDWGHVDAMQALVQREGGLPAPADVAAPPSDAKRMPSGLASRVLVPGTGDLHPGPHDTVTVHYAGWTTDGRNFDTSFRRGRATSFPLDRVIAGWTEGVQLMVVGERRRFWIPQRLAYRGRPGRPKGMLVFDVQLLKIKVKPSPPTAPSDLSAPPAHARVEASGLASVVLRPGGGGVHPTLGQPVVVHYTGWTTDGRMFDSSVVRGRPITLTRTQVIPGWNEALGLMVAGEKRRVWIPESLAYKGRPGRPQGMLVFDIELLALKDE